jgi:hypothetical protein
VSLAIPDFLENFYKKIFNPLGGDFSAPKKDENPITWSEIWNSAKAAALEGAPNNFKFSMDKGIVRIKEPSSSGTGAFGNEKTPPRTNQRRGALLDPDIRTATTTKPKQTAQQIIQKGNNTFHINIKGQTMPEIINELVPHLKLLLDNM